MYKAVCIKQSVPSNFHKWLIFTVSLIHSRTWFRIWTGSVEDCIFHEQKNHVFIWHNLHFYLKVQPAMQIFCTCNAMQFTAALKSLWEQSLCAHIATFVKSCFCQLKLKWDNKGIYLRYASVFQNNQEASQKWCKVSKIGFVFTIRCLNFEKLFIHI